MKEPLDRRAFLRDSTLLAAAVAVSGCSVFSDTDVAAPSIIPTSGAPGTDFGIGDPQGRMANADRIIFTTPSGDPATGAAASNPEFREEGTIALGLVPFVSPGDYDVTVHAGDPSTSPPLLESLRFTVT